MTTDIATIRGMVTGFKDEAEFVRAYLELDNAIRVLRELKTTLEQHGLEWMQNNDIREVWLEKDKIKLYMAKDSKDRFDTQAIYKALAFTEEQQAVLPKNPAFRKTAILANEKTAPAHYEEEKDTLKLKEVDVAMLKNMGRV